MGASTASVLAPKQQQQANKSKASKTKRLQNARKAATALGQRSEVTDAPAGSAAMSPRSAPRTPGSGCCVSRWGRSVEEAGLQTDPPGHPTLHRGWGSQGRGVGDMGYCVTRSRDGGVSSPDPQLPPTLMLGTNESPLASSPLPWPSIIIPTSTHKSQV